MRVRQVGTAALLLDVDDPAGWFDELWRRRDAGELYAVEIVPGAQTVLLDGVPDPALTAAQIRQWRPPAVVRTTTHALVPIPVTYDGEDLASVAELWRTSERGVINRLNSTEFQVAYCGFSPGWAYLAGLPPALAVPRLASPRAKVPAGSVALGGEYAGIYPTASPGGWRLVGRTAVALFDPERDPPALLTPGTRVRFIEVTS